MSTEDKYVAVIHASLKFLHVACPVVKRVLYFKCFIHSTIGWYQAMHKQWLLFYCERR